MNWFKTTIKEINNYFHAHETDIARDNWHLLRQLCWVYLACLLAYYLLVCRFQDFPAQSRALIVAMIVQAVYIACVWCMKPDRVKPLTCIIFLQIFGVSIIALAIYLGTVVFPDNSALLFPLLLIMMVQFYSLPPYVAMGSVFIEFLVFLVFSFILKDFSVFLLDIISSIVALFIAIISYLTSARAKMENGKRQDELHYLSRHDALTGLLNRIAFNELLEERIHNGATGKYALAILDVDKFKIINDSLGHVMGDNVLRDFSRIISEGFSAGGYNAIVSRFGGDEFLAFLTDVDNCAGVRRLLSALFLRIDELSRDLGLEITCSVGVVVASGNSGELDPLLIQADLALYAAKETEGNSYQVIEV